VSARPSVPRLEGEELDLLISRSLDGDLSPDEKRDLETVLSNDPAARRRAEELAGLVAEARALPSPAPPFALSTRVNANVSEKAARGGSIFHRFGFYPPPGLAIGAMVVLAVVAVAITVTGPAPRRVATTIAERADGPVEVFFQEGKRGKDAAKKAAVPPSESVGAKIASKEKAREEGAAAQSAPASILEKKQADSVVASNEPLRDRKLDDKNDEQSKLLKSEADAGQDARANRQAPAESSALSAAAPRAAGGVSPVAPAAPAPAAPAPAVRAMRSAEPRAWSVAIRGEGAKRWMLRRAPESRPSTASVQASSFRVTLDAEGRVTAVRALDARAVQPALLEFVRGLVFAPVGSSAGNVVGTVADGLARDREQKPKDERVDALESLSEIEVEVSAH
jgi:cytochrome c551/c552